MTTMDALRVTAIVLLALALWYWIVAMLQKVATVPTWRRLALGAIALVIVLWSSGIIQVVALICVFFLVVAEGITTFIAAATTSQYVERRRR